MYKIILFGIILISSLYFTACDQISDVKDKLADMNELIQDDLKILGHLAEQYGGSWNKNLDDQFYTIEITNSERLSNPDSLEYHAIYISRFLKDSLNTHVNYLKLILTSESKVAVFSSTNSKTYIEDMDLASEFKNVPIEKYIPMRNGIYMMRKFAFGEYDEARSFYKYFEENPSSKNEYYYLGKAARADYLTRFDSVPILINKGLEMSENDHRFYKHASFLYFHLKDTVKATEYIDKSISINKNERNLTDRYSLYLYSENLESALNIVSELMLLNPKDFNNQIRKYNLLNEMDNDSLACIQMDTLLKIAPQIQIPDSLKAKCY